MLHPDPDRLFERSLNAELEAYPHLAELNMKSEIDDPGVLFSGRGKGYFVAPRLCRVPVLKVFEESRARGEPFVMWHDPEDGSSHDGSLVFAHHMSIRYVDLHVPAMSVLFGRKGNLKCSSERFRKIRDYIYAHRVLLARRCNDMTKQTYGSKKWLSRAWEPLHNWLFEDTSKTPERLAILTNFGRDDTEFHSVVAECMWRFATGPNNPWRIAATQPNGYSVVDDFKKVYMLQNNHSVVFLFFFSILLHVLTCEHRLLLSCMTCTA